LELGEKRRKIVQTLAFFAQNPFVNNFLSGRIFRGKSKGVCVPTLNCYSCPAAGGSCPIGSLQAVASGYKHDFSFYVFGLIMIFGLAVGRFWCGWICPFGLFQEFIHKIPFLKCSRISAKWKRMDKLLRYLKYIVLVVMVFLLPIILVDDIGFGNPTFCKYICPAGTLGGGLPMVIANTSLQNTIGVLFWWKVSLLIFFVVLSLSVVRPFCKYVCPLGAIYGFFNGFSFFRLQVDEERCVSCGKCERVCPMDVDILKNINSMECIRCGKCKNICPTSAISVGTVFKKQKIEIKGEKNNEKCKVI